jgi:hypothetical protein
MKWEEREDESKIKQSRSSRKNTQKKHQETLMFEDLQNDKCIKTEATVTSLRSSKHRWGSAIATLTIEYIYKYTCESVSIIQKCVIRRIRNLE